MLLKPRALYQSAVVKDEALREGRRVVGVRVDDLVGVDRRLAGGCARVRRGRVLVRPRPGGAAGRGERGGEQQEAEKVSHVLTVFSGAGRK